MPSTGCTDPFFAASAIVSSRLCSNPNAVPVEVDVEPVVVAAVTVVAVLPAQLLLEPLRVLLRVRLRSLM